MKTARKSLAALLSAALVLHTAPAFAQVRVAPTNVRTAPTGSVGNLGPAALGTVGVGIPQVRLQNFSLGANPSLSAAAGMPTAVAPGAQFAQPNAQVLPRAAHTPAAAIQARAAHNFASPVAGVPASLLLPRNAAPLRPTIPGLVEGAREAGHEGGAKTTADTLRATAGRIEKGAERAELDAMFDGRGAAFAQDINAAEAGWASLNTRRMPGLQYAANARAQDADIVAAGADKVTLRAPSGETIDTLLVRTHEQEEAALHDRAELPAQGVLTVGHAHGEFDIWVKSQLVPLDIVIIGDNGLITQIIEKVGPARPELHWTKTQLIKARGRHMLTLPAGGVERYELREGAALSVVAAETNAALTQSPARLAQRLLSRRQAEVEAVAASFNRYERDDARLGALLKALQAEGKDGREAAGDFIRRVWGAQNTHGAYEGLMKRHFPGQVPGTALWKRAVMLPFTILSALFTFVHESGHYLVGKAFGMKVVGFEVFANGSGYVQFDGASVQGKPAWQRIAMSLAGAAFETLFVAAVVGSFAVFAAPALFSALSAGVAVDPSLWLWAVGAWVSASRLFATPIGAHYDFVSVLHDMGFKRFAAEWAWREQMRRRRRLGTHGPLGYYRTALGMFSPFQARARARGAQENVGGMSAQQAQATAAMAKDEARSFPKLARRLQSDFGLDDGLRADLDGLRELLAAMDVKSEAFARGMTPVRRARMTRFFQWLRQQLESEGNLPLFERTAAIASSGYYDEATGVSFFNDRRNGSRYERLATLAHEAYHRFAAINNLPLQSGGRLVQEDDALLVEILLWNHIEFSGTSARLSGRMRDVLTDLRAGRGEDSAAAFVDSLYGFHDEKLTIDGKLRAELEARLSELKSYRKDAAALKKREKERAEAMLDARIAALEAFLNK